VALVLQVSAFFRISEQDYPYRDTHACVRKLVDTFGARRLMYGSDFPWVTEKCGYVNAWNVLPDGLLSEEEEAWIMGGTLASLFPRHFRKARRMETLAEWK
jgi:predicted TIM-barrel fold metal-dependent hydrolase